MSRAPSHRLSPLASSLKIVAVASALALAEQASAIEIRNPQTIDGDDAQSAFELYPGGVLTANGASTFRITMDGESKLILNGSVVDGTATGDAIYMSGGETVINGSTVTGSLRALVAGSNQGPSTVRAYNSVLTGRLRGALVSTGSDLYLENTNTSAYEGIGIEVFGGRVAAVGGTITGTEAGIALRRDPFGPGGVSTLELNGTKVDGGSGPAIWIRDSATADIKISNGTTLAGANNTLLYVPGGSVSMQVDNSHLTGDVDATPDSTVNLMLQNGATLTGQLKNVDSLALNSQGQWNMVGDGSVGSLSLDGGKVKFGEPEAYYQLNVGSLSGSGTFIMDADFVTGEHDFLNVAGQATGNHTLLIGSSGADPVAESEMHVVHTDGGDAQFALLNGPVDLGAFSYDLSQRGNDWYLDTSTKVISPGTRSVLALFNTAPTVWYGELSTLRSRMGELRMDGGKAGGWIRTYGNKYDVSASSGVGYTQTQQGISFGADAPLPVGDGQWLVGLLGGYSKSDLDLERGTSGEVASYYVGAYTTWLDAESGYYVDGVLKFNRFQNESKVQLSDGTRAKGDYDNSGVGASIEVGRHIKLDNDYFVEPYTQLSGVVIQGKDYDLDNGLNAEGDRTRSLLGKVGATLGRNFDMGDGRAVQPYVRAAYAHEFAKRNEVRVNENLFNNDLSGSRGELGAGVAIQLADRLQGHIDLDYSNGNNIEQPWGANFGVRYSW